MPDTQYESKALEVYQLSPGWHAAGQNISAQSHFYYIEANIIDLFEAYGVRAHVSLACLKPAKCVRCPVSSPCDLCRAFAVDLLGGCGAGGLRQ